MSERLHDDPPIVSTRHGRLRGLSATADTFAHLGVPYASPPVGRLRWAPPEAPAAWRGVRDALAFGPDPIQPKGLRTSRAPSMSEDCLYLNVWVPKERRDTGWPVLVWLCGGGFTTGSGAFAEEDPARLAARGAVIVSVNIRLNIFGFLAHPGLSAESPHGSSGNYGLLDLAAALRWVRANIAAFGGDTERITFFGESAGATVGMLLMASPIVSRPYDRAIFQSPGSFDALLPREAAERHGVELGDDIAEIRMLPAGPLLERAKRLPAALPSLWLARPLRPIVDGWVIEVDDPLSAGEFRPVPAIIGTNADEGHFFEARMGVKSMADLKRFTGEVFGDEGDAALRHYHGSGDGQVGTTFSAIYGDRGFNYPVDRLVRNWARRGGQVHRYVYTYQHSTICRPPTHSEENGVLMDLLPHGTAADRDMATIMAQLWLAFARTGDPSEAGLVDWPRCDERSDRFLKLELPLAMHSGWRSDHVAFVAANLRPDRRAAPHR